MSPSAYCGLKNTTSNPCIGVPAAELFLKTDASLSAPSLCLLHLCWAYAETPVAAHDLPVGIYILAATTPAAMMCVFSRVLSIRPITVYSCSEKRRFKLICKCRRNAYAKLRTTCQKSTNAALIFPSLPHHAMTLTLSPFVMRGQPARNSAWTIAVCYRGMMELWDERAANNLNCLLCTASPLTMSAWLSPIIATDDGINTRGKYGKISGSAHPIENTRKNEHCTCAHPTKIRIVHRSLYISAKDGRVREHLYGVLQETASACTVVYN